MQRFKISTTLSFGYELPETGDLGSVWFPALEDNIQQLNDHTHNGTDSSKLTSSAITTTTVSVPSGSWSATSGGRYRQVVTMPSGMDFDEYMVLARNAATGHHIIPTVEKINDTTFYIYTNDNSLTFTAYFVS